MVAGYLIKNAQERNVAAQIFFLKTQAKWRENNIEKQAPDVKPFINALGAIAKDAWDDYDK